MPLTDAQARKAAPRDKPYKLFDGGGLHLLVATTGARSWRLKYRFAGKEKLLTFGLYPEVGLGTARDLRAVARQALREHKDPAVLRVQARAAAHASARSTFQPIALDWHEAQLPRWSPAHAATVLERMHRDLFPTLGPLPIRDIDITMVHQVLKAVQARGAIESAHRIRQIASAVFVFAAAQGLCGHDPAEKLGQVIKPMPKKTSMPALTDVAQLLQLLADMDKPETAASVITRAASRFLALTAPRPGVVRAIDWSEIEGVDWSTGATTEPTWRIPAARMKLALDLKAEEAFEHLIPLSRQAVAVLMDLRPFTARARYVFPQIRFPNQPMSENTIGFAYNRAGYRGRHVPHGWRAAFSTIMNEIAERAGRDKDREVIDLFLAHRPRGLSSSESAYNRAAYLPRRRELAQEWADLIMAERTARSM